MCYHIFAFIAGFVLDLLIGDPHFIPHPVRLIGSLISFLDKRLNCDAGYNSSEKKLNLIKYKRGMLLAFAVIFATFAMSVIIIVAAYSINLYAGVIAEAVMTWQILATKCLKVESMKVYEQLQKQKDFAPGDSLVVKEYINNMPELLAAADLVISRAGALTLAELEAVGRAAVLIPSPNVAENHQYYNAMELQKAGAAVVIEEKDLTGEKLVQTVSAMLAQPGKLAEMGKNARSLSVDDSLDRITAALLKLVKTP